MIFNENCLIFTFCLEKVFESNIKSIPFFNIVNAFKELNPNKINFFTTRFLPVREKFWIAIFPNNHGQHYELSSHWMRKPCIP